MECIRPPRWQEDTLGVEACKQKGALEGCSHRRELGGGSSLKEENIQCSDVLRGGQTLEVCSRQQEWGGGSSLMEVNS